jgi:orotate phosphoribosyltransferase
MISREQALEILRETGVMLEGHFLLTSGRHSDRYMQCARLFENTKYSELLCKDLAERFKDKKIDMTIGPALGGVIIAYETARALGVKNIFAERQDGVMTIRRALKFPKARACLCLRTSSQRAARSRRSWTLSARTAARASASA